MIDIPVLSTVLDTKGHTIERHENNELRIMNNHNGHKVTPDEHATIAAWYWQHVALKEV